jgi:hypothetical protein
VALGIVLSVRHGHEHLAAGIAPCGILGGPGGLVETDILRAIRRPVAFIEASITYLGLAFRWTLSYTDF